MPASGHAVAAPEALPAGWVRGSDLLDGGALDRALAACQVAWGAAPGPAAGMLFKSYAYWAALPGVAAWAEGREVPDLSLGNVTARLDPPAGVAVALPRPGALAPGPTVPGGSSLPPGDPPNTSTVPAQAVPAQQGPLARLRRGLVDGHLLPLAAALHRRTRVGWRGLHGSVAAGSAQALLDTLAGRGQDPVAATERLLGALGGGYPSLVEVAGGTVALRRTCCLAFRARDQRPCTTCPLRGLLDSLDGFAGSPPGHPAPGNLPPR